MELSGPTPRKDTHSNNSMVVIDVVVERGKDVVVVVVVTLIIVDCHIAKGQEVHPSKRTNNWEIVWWGGGGEGSFADCLWPILLSSKRLGCRVDCDDERHDDEDDVVDERFHFVFGCCSSGYQDPSKKILMKKRVFGFISMGCPLKSSVRE